MKYKMINLNVCSRLTKGDCEFCVKLTVVGTTFKLDWKLKSEVRIPHVGTDSQFHSRRIHFSLMPSLDIVEPPLPEINVRDSNLYNIQSTHTHKHRMHNTTIRGSTKAIQ